MATHNGIVLFHIIFLLLGTIKASESLMCNNRCGSFDVKYPFGIGEGCYFDKSFEILCDNNYNSTGSSRPLLRSINLYIFSNMALGSSLIPVEIPVIPLNGSSSSSNNNNNNSVIMNTGSDSGKGVNLTGTPFSFSQRDNRLMAAGCDNYAKLNSTNSSGKCQSVCTCDPTQYRDCCDLLCTVPSNTKILDLNTSSKYYQNIPQECASVFVIQQDWLFNNYQTNAVDLKYEDRVPAVLEWGKYRGTCNEEYNSYTKICNKDNQCLLQLGSGHFCACGYSTSVASRYCAGDLIYNTTSGYNSSECPQGYYQSRSESGQESRCWRNTELILGKKSRNKYIIIGSTSAALGMLCLLTGAWWLHKFVKKRMEIMVKEKFFKRNGGLLLQQELGSNEGNIEKTKLFTSKELEKATHGFDRSRILGQGGQGTVYKGMLADGKIVAVKKSKVIGESKVDEFINEVVILSQINHRNVVKLLGCCLETDVPLLVYEFIINGTLYDYLHDQNEEFPITWEMRLRIAVEVSGALSYLHSAASIPIYHRDIKSKNILLDDKYRAKVSDFGASRSMAVDQTHATTQVQGTFGYLDPEYFRSGQFTEKSDVYSFGVVLAELLTGERAVRVTNDSEEDKSLAAYFLSAMKEERLIEILDGHVLKEACKDEIVTVARLTKKCLSLNGKKRPTMREVAVVLAGIKESNNRVSNVVQENNVEEIDWLDDQDDDDDDGDHMPENNSESTGASFTNSYSDSVTISVDADPLMSNKW